MLVQSLCDQLRFCGLCSDEHHLLQVLAQVLVTAQVLVQPKLGVGTAPQYMLVSVHTGFTALAFPSTLHVLRIRLVVGFDFLHHHCPMAEHHTCIVQGEITEILLQLALVTLNTL